MLAVEVRNLNKSFTMYESFFDRLRNKGIRVEALKKVDLEIKKGELFGLLGPNGAGKTTMMNILSTLLIPDSGSANIFGLDVVKQAEEVRKIISLSSAYSGFYDEITVKENLEIFAMHYNLETNVRDFISLVGLEEYENKIFEELSSGNRQKLSIAKTLMVNPKVMLLDELTVALDPNIAMKMKRLLKNWRSKNKTTIILTTHNMYEAEELCERVAIIHKGKVVTCDTPKKLKEKFGKEECIEVVVAENKTPGIFLIKLEGVKGISFRNGLVKIFVDDSEERFQTIMKKLLSKNYHIKSAKIKELTLEDVFIRLTGARLE